MSSNTNFHRKGFKSQHRERALQMETLEERALLSASPLDTDAAGMIPAMVASAEASETPAPENVALVDLAGVELQGPKALPIVANADGGSTQTVVFTDDASQLAVPTLSVEAYDANALMATVGSVPNASGYTLEYSTNADFSDAVSQNVSAGTTFITGLSVNTTYYFRVKAVGTGEYSDSDYSETRSISLQYNTHDLACLQTFLEQTDANGVKNGTKLNANYDENDLSTWSGVTWEESNGENRVTMINWVEKQLVGSLDVSECTALRYLFCNGNQLTALNVAGDAALSRLLCHSNQLAALNVTGCTTLTVLQCENNQLTALDVTGCTALQYLSCSSNQLDTLDVAECAALWELSCGNNPLISLDVSKNTALGALYCWNATLNNVVLPSARQEGVYVDLAENSETNWTFKDADGNTLGTNVFEPREYYELETATVLPIYAINAAGTQKVVFTDMALPLAVPALSVRMNGLDAVAVTVGEVENAAGYVLECSTSEDFSDAVSQNVSAGETNINGLTAGTKYYFRAMATGWGIYRDSDYSAVKNATPGGARVSINGKKVTVTWEDDSPVADSVRYRVIGTARWTVKKLKAGETTFSFNAQVGTNYEIEVLLDQQENNVLPATAVVLDQPKLSANKASIHDDTFQVSVTNYTAKNLAANVTQAILTVNGTQTVLDIAGQQGAAVLANGGNVTFDNGLFTFTEMASNTQYKMQVSFSDGLSVSTASSALNVKTLKAPYLAPEILSATAISDTSILVEWATAYGKKTTIPAQKYTVQYSTDGVKWSNATTGATGNSFTIQRLKGGMVYQVRVLASKDNAFDASEPSDVLVAETLALPKVTLDKASLKDDTFQLNVTNYQTTNLVKATAMNVVTDKFGTAVVELQNGAGSAAFDNGMNVAFENGVLLFTEAPSNTQMKIQLSFTMDACTTALSQALTVKTTVAQYNTPVILNGFAASSTSITVEWETVYGKKSTIPAQTYTVQYSLDGARWTNATTKATGTSFTITKLKANTRYLIAVLATKDQQFLASDPSEAWLVTTME